MPKEVVQGPIHGQAVLPGPCQAVEVGQQVGVPAPQVEVQLPSAAQLEQEKGDPPPRQEPPVISDQRLKAGIRQFPQPLRQFRPEMPDRPDQGLSQFYERPARRRRSWTWPSTRAIDSCEISCPSCLRRLCSWL